MLLICNQKPPNWLDGLTGVVDFWRQTKNIASKGLPNPQMQKNAC